MPSMSPDVSRHLALLAADVRDGIGVEVEQELPATASAGSRTESEAARSSGFIALSVDAQGRPARHVGTPLSLLTACWALARAGMPSLPDIPDAATFATERASLTASRPNPPFSTGGACRALRAADGWWALSLARPEDVELVPALTGAPVDDPWRQLEEVSVRRPVSALVALALELGLPASAVGAEVPDGSARPFRWEWAGSGSKNPAIGSTGSVSHGVEGIEIATAVLSEGGRRLRVLDLTGLWAGPLCGSLLASAGYDVVKVESPRRPDGARSGDSRFFDLVNARKRCVALDFDDDREALAALVSQADVVLEGSRPEALAIRGIRAADVAARGGVWVRFSAYPTDDPTNAEAGSSSRVGFGDDVALGAGLRVDDGSDSALPCGDALADPLTGVAALAALAVTLRAIADGSRSGGCVLGVPMAHVAARAAHVQPADSNDTRAARPYGYSCGPTARGGGEESSVPDADGRAAHARALGADTASVLHEWCGPEWSGG